MIRKKKKYVRPKKAFEKARIEEENVLLKKYALKSKTELWKVIAKVNYFRKRAKELAKESSDEQQILFDKLKELGLKADTITDVLALKVEDLLEIRLPTILVKKGFAKTTKEARQMVAHKRIMIEGRVIDAPGYLVSLAEEKSISLKKKTKKPKPEEKPAGEKKEEAPAEEKAQEEEKPKEESK